VAGQVVEVYLRVGDPGGSGTFFAVVFRLRRNKSPAMIASAATTPPAIRSGDTPSGATVTVCDRLNVLPKESVILSVTL
jgi:hypothetical protein